MNMIQTLQNKKTKRGTLFAGGLAAGLMTMGISASAGASPYGWGGGYSSDEGSQYGSSASYEQASYYSETEKSYSRTSCSYAAEWRYDSSQGGWDWMSYDASSGVWYSCDSESSYEHSVQAAEFVKAHYDVNYASYGSSNRYD